MLIGGSNAAPPNITRITYWPNNALWGEGDCPVHCRRFHSNPDLDSLHASSTPSHDNQRCLMTLPRVFLGGKIRSSWEPLLWEHENWERDVDSVSRGLEWGGQGWEHFETVKSGFSMWVFQWGGGRGLVRVGWGWSIFRIRELSREDVQVRALKMLKLM